MVGPPDTGTPDTEVIFTGCSTPHAPAPSIARIASPLILGTPQTEPCGLSPAAW
ncbi:MAG: hypothetical protein R3D59_15575 [Paracoccaceae bacterium]